MLERDVTTTTIHEALNRKSGIHYISIQLRKKEGVKGGGVRNRSKFGNLLHIEGIKKLFSIALKIQWKYGKIVGINSVAS